jgi:hypothetical protein
MNVIDFWGAFIFLLPASIMFYKIGRLAAFTRYAAVWHSHAAAMILSSSAMLQQLMSHPSAHRGNRLQRGAKPQLRQAGADR